jgi:hypothetical protein
MLYPRSGADVGVGGDAVHAVHAQRARGVDEHRLRLEDAGGDHRLEHVELELPAFGGHRHGQVAADHAEADHVDDLGITG